MQAWSADYPGYDPREVATKWRAFGKVEGAKVTANTLFAEARKHGWSPVEVDDFDDDLEGDDALSVESLLGPDPKTSVHVGGLTFRTPDQYADLPARDYLVKRLIAPGQIGCIFGEPGAGKSVFAPWLSEYSGDIDAESIQDTVDRFDADWERAQQMAKKIGWEGEIRGKARVFLLPGDDEFEYAFVWRQYNNGIAFVVSPFSLEYLKDL